MARPGMSGYCNSFRLELAGDTVRIIIECGDETVAALLHEHLYDHIVKGQLKLELFDNSVTKQRLSS